jgi:glycosyltransferase involved in cell wall biosynthesis
VRILQLHNHHSSKGGAMEVLAHEGELLREAGHDVEELTLAATESLGLSSSRQAVKAIWNKEIADELATRIGTFKPDVVHVHTPFPLMSPVVFRTAHQLGVPTVTTLHSYRWSCVAGTCVRDGHTCEDCVGSKLKLPGIRHRCYHDSLAGSAALTISLALHRGLGTQAKCVDRWLTLTSFAKRLLVRDGIDEAKITVKPNSVPDLGVGTGPEPGDRTLVFAGRLIAIKGVHALIEAWRDVSGKGVRLIIAGDGELRPEVEALVADCSDVSFVGWVPEDEVTDLMRAAEAVLVPSEWYEGLPLVILRSLSVGTPVITSDLENFAEDVVADRVGETFPVGDAAALREVLRRVIDDPVQLRNMRERARASYEKRYSPTVDVTRLEEVYADLIG